VETRDTRYKWWVLSMVASTTFFTMGLSWMCMPVLFREISEKTGWAMPDMIASWGMIPLAVMLFNLPAGLVGDRFGFRWVGGTGIVLCGVLGSLRGLAGTYPQFLITMFLYGTCFPFAFVLMPKAIASHFGSAQLAMANGVNLGAYGAGAALALTFSGTWLSPRLGGWQHVVYLWGGVSVLLGVLWLWTIRDHPDSSREAGVRRGVLASLGPLVKNRQVLILCLIHFSIQGGWLGASGSYPMLGVTARGLPPAAAGNVVSLSLLLYVVTCFILPGVSDRIGLRRPVYCIGMLLSGAGMFLTFVFPPPWIWAWVVVWGVFAGVVPIVVTIPMETPGIGPKSAGTAMGLIYAFGNLGGFAYPMIITSLTRDLSPAAATVRTGMLCGLAGYALTGLLVWGLQETGSRSRQTSGVLGG